MGGLGRGGSAQRLVGLGSGILSVDRTRGEVDKLERREWGAGTMGVVLDDEPVDELAVDVLEELPTTSNIGWSLSDGGTGGGWGLRDEMPRDKRGRAGRDGGGNNELDGSCDMVVRLRSNELTVRIWLDDVMAHPEMGLSAIV
ncbi:hypothetical protein FS749_008644 [Ceratobasidium sp. UAMH 11750]|nr:hypothetical protein FS749_008644 [Ceratobasidium sp. UAMH 11750]